MALPPLTHHDILSLAEPFVRRGRAPDLAASDRAARRLAFRAVEHAARDGLPPLTEALDVTSLGDGRLRLRRVLRTADGLGAWLEAEGRDGGALLDALAAVPAARQFVPGAGTLIALGQRLGDSDDGGGSAAPSDPPLRLRAAEARLPGWVLRAEVSRVKGYPADLELAPAPGPGGEGAAAAELPEDLLAVLGPAWGRLAGHARGWRSTVALRGAEPQRSTQGEARLRRTVEHLADTLAGPPARFHERHRLARWRVALSDTVPLLVGGGIVGTALLVQRQGPGGESVLALLANLAPPLLMGLFFLRREMPRIGLPRVPRRPAPGAWQPMPR